ncbi:sigma-54 interaction domain-containing protein, partial [Desulfosporosinus metallidurans]|uniref:sigma-54 interaction domain-containing protein n=1 Tax=Desulfosporosinus metallidurans TaxID=1888891 RepID=UPI00094DD159
LVSYQKASTVYKLLSSTNTFDSISSLLSDLHAVYSFADRNGLLLHIGGDEEYFDIAYRLGYVPGTDWSEEKIGTNAIGNCISQKRLTIVKGTEHYCQVWHPYDCAAVPIFFPPGELAAVFAISGSSGELPSIGILANFIAGFIQMQLQENEPKEQKRCQGVKYKNTTTINCFDNIIGQNSNFKRSIELARKVAMTSSILLEGETGTGKEVFARAIHMSSRPETPFVALNCGAFSRELVVSELFGYEEGAFTGAKKSGHPGKFEQAYGGTLFLDEVGELPSDIQVMLLRVLQNREVVRIGGQNVIPIDVRIIAATNRVLFEEVKQGRFRLDLFYRLNVVNITLPSLRERVEDIPLLWDRFLETACSNTGKVVPSTTDTVRQILLNYSWPGNIRELQNAAERVSALATDKVTLDHLPQEILSGIGENKHENVLRNLEKQAIKNALIKANGNKSLVAKFLGLSRPTIYRKMKEYQL